MSDRPGSLALDLMRPGAGFLVRRLADRLAAALITLCAALAVAVLGVVLAYVVAQGLPALNLAFFLERPLPYGEVGGGVAPAILGSLLMLAVASLIALPVGIGAAIYLVEFAPPRHAAVIRFATDLVAGLPSIVVGVFVWALLVRQVVGHYSGLAGSVALAVIMIPIVTRTVEEMLKLVPDTLREAAYALGIPRWRTVVSIVLPVARNGIVTGVVLAIARAGGETAPLMLTALGNLFFNFDLLQPTAALPLQIYSYAISPYADWHTKAWGSAFVLIVLVGGVNLLARLATRSHRLR